MPLLGYLNSYYCPVCGKYLFSHYDVDVDHKDGYKFRITGDWNYYSKCGALLDLSEWKEKKEPDAGEELVFED